MRRFGRKNFKGKCPECNRVRTLRLVNEVEDLGIVWMRCKKCLGTHYYPTSGLLRSGRVLTKREIKKRNSDLAEIKEYTPEKKYWIGQKIHHPDFDDVGKIVKKEKTEGLHETIVVDFENRGLTKLVEGYST